MHPSSIFSSKTFQAQLRLSNWWIYFLLLLVLGELFLRLPVVTDHLPKPEPTLWHAALIQTKMDYLKNYEKVNDIDVLFIGNSAVQAGINPQVFDQGRLHKDGSTLRAFNAGIEGLPPYGVKLFLEIYLRYTHPATIIYGVTPQDLNSNSPWAKDVTERVKNSPLALAEARRGLTGQVTARLLEYSYLYRYRFLLHQLLLHGGVVTALPDVYFDERGFHPTQHRLSDVPKKERGIYYNRAGVLNYSIEGEQLASLKELIAYCADRDIQLVLVNMPLAEDYFANFDSPEDYQTYLITLKTVADESKIPLWDMGNLPEPFTFKDNEFADFNHLNEYGAEKLSSLIVEQYNQWVELPAKAGMP